MSDNQDYLKTSEGNFRLRADVLALMLKGAGYAAAFCVVVGVFLAVTIWIGTLLPPESQEAPDPSLGSVFTIETTAQV
jgi:hypothetical protein